MHILKTPELCIQLKGNHLALLGENLPCVAMHILNTPELCNKLHPDKKIKFEQIKDLFTAINNEVARLVAEQLDEEEIQQNISRCTIS